MPQPEQVFSLRGQDGRTLKITGVKEEDVTVTILRSIEPKCCGCGEKDHKKLDTMTITMPYSKITLKPETYICYDCIEKIRRKEGDGVTGLSS